MVDPPILSPSPAHSYAVPATQRPECISRQAITKPTEVELAAGHALHMQDAALKSFSERPASGEQEVPEQAALAPASMSSRYSARPPSRRLRSFRSTRLT